MFIFGFPLVGQTLTASTENITDANGLRKASYSYQWIRVAADSTETDIPGATSSTYQPTTEDLGSTIKVRMMVTDDGGFVQSLTATSDRSVGAALDETADCAATTATACSVEVDGSKRGAVSTLGDEDWWSVSLEADTTYLVTVRIVDVLTFRGDPEAILYDSSGSELVRNDDVIDGIRDDSALSYTVSSSGAGSYFVGVKHRSGGTRYVAYRVSVYELSAVDETTDCAASTATACSVAVDDSARGDLSTSSDVDWWAVDLEAGVSYRIDVEGYQDGGGTLGDPEAVLKDTAGTVDLDSNGDRDASSLSSRITYKVPDTDGGKYYIAVSGEVSDTAGSYKVTVTTKSTTGAPSVSGVAQAGQTLTASTGDISDDDGLTMAVFSYQWVRVASDSTETDIEGATSATYVLTDTDVGSQIKVKVSFTDDASNSVGPLASMAYPSGGSVSPALDETTDCAASTATACSVAVGGSKTGAIIPVGDADWWSVSLEADTVYLFVVSGIGVDPMGPVDPAATLYGSTGTQLAENDDVASGVVLDSALSYAVPSTGKATYYIGVKHWSDESQLSYRVSVLEVGPLDETTDCAASTATVCSAVVGGSVRGNLSTSSDADWWSVDLEAGVEYQIDVEGYGGGGGTLADPLAILKDTAGSVDLVEVDDRSGDSLDSRITYMVPDTDGGKYYIAVSDALTGHSGSYRVTVTANPQTTSNANLSGLVVTSAVDGSPQSLVEPFAETTTAYTLSVRNEVDVITVAATTAHPSAMLGFADGHGNVLDDADGDKEGRQLRLDVGVNTIRIVVTAVDTSAQTYTLTVTRATTPDAPASLTATQGYTEVALTWTAPVSDGGDPITKYQYRVSDDGGTTWSPDWTDVPDGSDSGADQADERTLTITGLTNVIEHTFQVRAVNGSGSGSMRQATATPAGAPALQSAEIDAAELTLEFSNTLDATSRPARSAFEVKVRGTAVSLSSSNPVSISGRAVTLRLGSPVTAGDTVTVSYTAPGANPIKDDAALEAPSFTDEPVTNNTPNAPATGKPVISGTPQRDETLTVSTTGIRDDDGLSDPRYSYRWLQVETEAFINGPQSYLLTRDDIGKKIKVIVGFFDDAGEYHTLESDAFPRSGTIQNKPNRQPTGRPTLSGTYQVGHTLTADTSGIDDPDGLTNPGYTYQWQRRESGVYTDISGATQMVYTLTPDDQGKRVRVQVTFTDDDENVHTLESSPSGVVQAQTSLPSSKVKVSLDATAYVVEEGDTIQVTVTLAEAPEDRHVIIPFTVTPANGAIQDDFTAWSSYTRQLRFDVGDTTDRINIRADDDTLNDDGETLTLCLGDLPEPYATLAGLDCATINIMDNDDPNSVRVTFRSDTYWASEDGNPAWPRISVHPVPDREITIPITFTRGGGLSEDDYSIVTTRVKFGPGLYGVHGDGHLSDDRTYASFPIEIWAIDDREDDDGEYLDLAFGDLPPFVSAGGTGKFSYRPTTARVWFNDNEFTEVPVTNPPPNIFQSPRQVSVSFADAELEATEGQYELGTVATVRVRLSRRRDVERTVTIPITVTAHGAAPGVDYVATDIPSQLTFLPGQTEQSFRVRAINDGSDDDDEYLTISFGTLPERVLTGSTTTTRINLIDDDDPFVTLRFEVSSYSLTVSEDSSREDRRIQVKAILSADPERTFHVGLRHTPLSGVDNIHLTNSFFTHPNTHGFRFRPGETESTVTYAVSSTSRILSVEAYELSFETLPDRVSTGNPAMATITINANP